MASRSRAEVERAQQANSVAHCWGIPRLGWLVRFVSFLVLFRRIRRLDFEARQPVPLGNRLAVVADH